MATDTTELLGHLAWCAQIALGIARRDKKVTTPLQEHIFLMNWLTTAQKKKLFSKAIACEIDYLIRTGKKEGILSNLKRKLTYIYKSCCEDIHKQTDLFRLTYAIEQLKTRGWESHTISTADWKKGWESAIKPAIYMELPALQAAFSDEGKQLTPLPIRIAGDIDYAAQILAPFLTPITSVCTSDNLLLLTP
ncbi:DUF2913 family protein [Salmonella enterica]|nr:DUF2913 family protein [Salmonella enterica]